jgi:hypothetical protein
MDRSGGWFLEKFAGSGDVLVFHFIDEDEYGFFGLFGNICDNVGHFPADLFLLGPAEFSGNPNADIGHDFPPQDEND